MISDRLITTIRNYTDMLQISSRIKEEKKNKNKKEYRQIEQLLEASAVKIAELEEILKNAKAEETRDKQILEKIEEQVQFEFEEEFKEDLENQRKLRENLFFDLKSQGENGKIYCLSLIHQRKSLLMCGKCNKICAYKELNLICPNNHAECTGCLEEASFCSRCKESKIIQNSQIFKQTEQELEIFEEILQELEGKIEGRSTNLLKTQFYGQNGKIIELKEFGGKFKEIVQRERLEERDDFVFWLGEIQFCAYLTDEKWFVSIWKGEDCLDSKETKGFSTDSDTFRIIGDNIYLTVYDPAWLYKIQVTQGKLEVEYLGKTSSYVYCLVEYKDSVIVGTHNKTIESVENGFVSKLYEMEHFVMFLRLSGSTVSAVDSGGNAVKIDLNSENIVQKVAVEGFWSNFITEQHIIGVNVDNKKIKVFDWNGKVLKELYFIPGNIDLFLFHSSAESTLLTDYVNIFLFDHQSLTLTKYNDMTPTQIYSHYE